MVTAPAVSTVGEQPSSNRCLSDRGLDFFSVDDFRDADEDEEIVDRGEDGIGFFVGPAWLA